MNTNTNEKKSKDIIQTLDIYSVNEKANENTTKEPVNRINK